MGQPTDDVENFNSIVPAAIIALGLMYLKTNDVDAADAFILGKVIHVPQYVLHHSNYLPF